MILKVAFLTILLSLTIGGCQTHSPESANSLTISAAASLKDAFSEIGNLYRTKTGGTVNFNFGASGVLQKQIETGAPIDIFASAGEKQMDDLAANGLIDAETRRNFARNTLALIAPSESKLGLLTFADLSKSDVQKIAIGNPKTVPAGQYTEQLFNKLALKDTVQPKLVQAEDVRQVLDWVERREADAGIVYATDAHIAGDKVSIVATAPEDSHTPILYPIAVIKNSQQKSAAQEFIDLVLSGEGQAILQKYGFVGISEK
jgi:molybdate transport system substrate-binding protein